MTLPAFHAHRAERQADQARVWCLAEVVSLAIGLLALLASLFA